MPFHQNLLQCSQLNLFIVMNGDDRNQQTIPKNQRNHLQTIFSYQKVEFSMKNIYSFRGNCIVLQ